MGGGGGGVSVVKKYVYVKVPSIHSPQLFSQLQFFIIFTYTLYSPWREGPLAYNFNILEPNALYSYYHIRWLKNFGSYYNIIIG